jgi:hypothetical protein
VRFVVLRKSEKWMESGAPPDPELITAMQRYDEEMRKAGVLVAVERLQPSATATRLHISGGKSHTIDGPFTETSELIAGVNILEVASKEEAIAWMKRCPTCQGDNVEAQFEIRAVFEAPPEDHTTLSS